MHRKSAFIVELLIVLSVTVLMGGCANEWQQHYQSKAGVAAMHFPPSEQVQIRVVTVKQIDAANKAEQKYFDEHDLAPEDMSAADARATRQMMLDDFRVKEDAKSVVLLGSSSFTGTEQVRSDDPRLISFAKSIGADFVVMASEYAGQKMDYTTVPETSNTTTTVTRSGGRHGRETSMYDSSTTTYVVIPVTFQQWSNVATFWRRVTPEERAKLDGQYVGAQQPSGQP